MQDTPVRPIAPQSPIPYIVVVVIMTVLLVVSILVLTIARPSADNTALILTLTAAIAPTTAAMLALISSLANNRLTGQTHVAAQSAYSEANNVNIKINTLQHELAQDREDNRRAMELAHADALHAQSAAASAASSAAAAVTNAEAGIAKLSDGQTAAAGALAASPSDPAAPILTQQIQPGDPRYIKPKGG